MFVGASIDRGKCIFGFTKKLKFDYFKTLEIILNDPFPLLGKIIASKVIVCKPRIYTTFIVATLLPSTDVYSYDIASLVYISQVCNSSIQN